MLLLRLQLLQLLDLLHSQRRRGVLLVRGALLITCVSVTTESHDMYGLQASCIRKMPLGACCSSNIVEQ